MPKINADAYGHRLSAIVRALSRKTSIGGTTSHAVVWDVDSRRSSGASIAVATSAWGISIDDAQEHLLVSDPYMGQMQMWDYPTRLAASPRLPVRRSIFRGDISGDGRQIVTATTDGFAVRKLPKRLKSLDEMRAWTTRSLGHRVNADGTPYRVTAEEWAAAWDQTRRVPATSASGPGQTPVDRLVALHTGVVAAYLQGGKQAISRDHGVSWRTDNAVAPADIVAGTHDGLYAYTPAGRQEIVADARAPAPDMGASTAALGSTLALRADDGRYWTSTDQGRTWSEHTPVNQTIQIHSLHAVDDALHGIAVVSPAQVHSLGTVSAVPRWRVLIIQDGEDLPTDPNDDWLASIGVGDEVGLSTVSGFPVPGRIANAQSPHEWVTYDAEDGRINISALTDNGTGRRTFAAYITTIVHSPRRQAARLLLQARDIGGVWLNGLPLEPRFQRHDSLWAPLQAAGLPYQIILREGPNALLVRVHGHWVRESSAHFTGAEGLRCLSTRATWVSH